MNFEILVIGDGTYVREILNAVSSVNSYGTLGAIGAVIGIVVMAFKQFGGQGEPKLDIKWILVSVVLFSIMFGKRVDGVIVTEVMAQPGNMAPRTFVVDNVPLGLAGPGYIVSTLGIKVFGLYDTVMGGVDSSTRVSLGALGRNLMVMAALRDMMSDPRFTDDGGYLSDYRANMSEYMSRCVMPQINSSNLAASKVLSSPGIDGAFNPMTASRAVPMRWREGEKVETVVCYVANERIRATSSGGTLAQKFDEAAGRVGGSIKARDLQGAFAEFANEAAMQSHTLIATAMLNAVAAEASVRGTLNPQETQAILMVEEAAHKRAVQWAGEENLFIRMLRPIVSFFEAFFYALAPIMALVVTLGPVGWGMVTKYMMITLWVMLWYPLAAVTQLYSSIMMGYFFDRLNSGSIAGQPYSAAQLSQIANEAMEQLGAASVLTASIPALTMFILFGGPIAMSAIAGRLQGGDVIDETKMAPDATQTAPVAQWGSAMSGNISGGNMFTGGGQASLSKSTVASEAKTRAEQWMQTSQEGLSRTLQEGVTKTDGTTVSGQEVVSSGWNNSHTDNLKQAAKAAHERGTISAEEMAFVNSMSDQQSADFGWSVSLAPKIAGLGGGVAGGDRGTIASTETDQRSLRTAENVARKIGTDTEASAAVAKQVASAAQTAVTTGAVSGTSAATSDTIAKSAQQVVAASDAYSNASAITNTTGGSEMVTYSEAATRISHAKGDGFASWLQSAETELKGSGLGNDLEHYQANHLRSGALSSESARVMAVYDTLRDQKGSDPELNAMYSDFVGSAFNAGYGNTGGVGSQVVDGQKMASEIGKKPGSLSLGGASGLTPSLPSADAVRSDVDTRQAGFQATVTAGHAEVAAARPDLPAAGVEMLDQGAKDVRDASMAGTVAVGATSAQATGNVKREVVGGPRVSAMDEAEGDRMAENGQSGMDRFHELNNIIDTRKQ